MRVEVDICAGGEAAVAAEQRLRFVLARFTASLVAVALRSAAAGPGRVRLSARVSLVNGEAVAITAEDEASEAATLHFVDRLGRAVARRYTAGGGRIV